MTEIREKDLRFTADEASAFFNETMKLNLETQAVTVFENRTEGWVAGLQLGAIALQENSGCGQFADVYHIFYWK